MTIKGIIMAGGQGKRFRPLTYYFQKCMFPIGTNEKPILEYIVSLFSYYKIRDLTILTGYKSQQISNYFNNGDRFGVKIKYVLDKPDQKGSANAILNAHNKGIINKQDTLIVYYGDILSNINLADIVEHHKEKEALATLALSTGFRVNVGTAKMEGVWIKDFEEKPSLETPVSIGIVVLSGSAIHEMIKLYNEAKYETFDLMGDVIQYFVKNNRKISGYITDAFWYDIGSIERYERLNNESVTEALDFLL
jgi:mannose-1-phosphate guanylyltransferase